MAQVLFVAVVALALLLAITCVVVWRLHAQVRRLAGELTSLRPTAEEGSRQARPPVAEAESRQARPPVPVITRLSDETVPADLTTARVASVALGRPLIKVAAFSYGVRRALDDEHRLRMRLAFRQELRRQRKTRRRAARTAAAVGPVAGSGS